MGAAQSCHMCTVEPVNRNRDVVIMKEDGEPVNYKQGTKVKDVLHDYPFHKIIRCCSGRTVLGKSFQLNANWLYFLLPEGLAVNDTTYQCLIRAALARGLIASHAGAPKGPHTIGGKTIVCSSTSKTIISSDDDEILKKNISWKPNLIPIEETSSRSRSLQSDKASL